jgi:hypothetical protein
MRPTLLLSLLLSSPSLARDFADAFERDADANGLPDGWELASPAGSLLLAAGRDGRALALAAPGSTSAAAVTRLSGRLDLAQDYVLAGWIRVDGADGASAVLSVQFTDERGDPLGPPQPTTAVAPGAGWTAVAFPVSLIDSRTRGLSIRAELTNRSGAEATAAFDDVTWVAKAFADGFEADLDKDGFPDRWRSVRSEEYPAFNAAETKLTSDDRRSGARAAALRTRGRNAGIETRWAASVDPDRSYELSVWVKTSGLEESAAWAEVEWLDAEEKTVGTARTVPARDTGGEFRELRLAVEALPAPARKARLRLAVGGDDPEGRAWFDDVEWIGRVRVRLDTDGRPGNVYPEESARAAGVSGNVVAIGLDAGAYEVFGTVSDGGGKAVWAGRIGGAELNVRQNLSVPFRFPVKEPGPYVARLEIRAGGQPGVQSAAAFGVAHTPVFPRGKRGDYGVSLNPYVHPARRPGAVLGLAGAGRARVRLWDPAARDLAALAADGPEMHDLLLDLRRHGVEPVGVLASPPVAAPGRSLADWFASRDRRWEGPLGRLVAAHRDVVALWEAGGDDRSLARAADPALVEEISKKLRAGHEFVALGLSFPSDLAPPAGDAVSFLVLPAGLDPAALHATTRADAREKLLLLDASDPCDLAWRAVAARAAGLSQGIADGDGRDVLDADGTPAPAWYALRVLNDLLSGATPVAGELLPGMLAFRKENRLVVAVRADPPRTLDAWLGADVLRVDVAGRAIRLAPDASGRLKLEASPALHFLVVSDAAFADTQLSGAFDGLPLKSRANPQPAVFRLANRFPDPIRNVRLLSVDLPTGWRPVALPREHARLDPGAAADFPLDFVVPSDSRPGDAEARLRVSFEAAGARREAVLVRTLPVRSDIEIAPRIEPTHDGRALEISVTVRNRGKRRANLKVTVDRGPALRPLEDVVRDLEPGTERVVRLAAEKDESGKEYRVALRGLEDDAFVNEVVRVP